jgi:hypothetical protein
MDIADATRSTAEKAWDTTKGQVEDVTNATNDKVSSLKDAAEKTVNPDESK